MKKYFILCRVVLIITLIFSLAVPAAFAKKTFNKKTTLLATLFWEKYQKHDIFDFAVDATGKKAAYVLREANDKQSVVLGKRKGKLYDQIEFLTFMPNGKDVVYVAVDGDKVFVVIGTKEQKPFDIITPTDAVNRKLQFFKNQIVYSARNTVSTDVGDETAFVPTAFVTTEESVVVVGEKIIKNATSPFVSANGKKFGYVSQLCDVGGCRERVVVSGKKGKSYVRIISPQFNNGGTVSYWAETDERDSEGFAIFVAVRNGKEIGSDEELHVTGHTIFNHSFTPDGKTPLVRSIGNKEEFKDEIEDLQELGGGLAIETSYHKEWYEEKVKIGDKIYEYDEGTKKTDKDFYFSPDSQFAGTYTPNGYMLVPVDGTEEEIYLDGMPVFSRDSERMAYEYEGKVFVDGEDIGTPEIDYGDLSPEAVKIERLTFLPNGSGVIYFLPTPSEFESSLHSLVINGEVGESYFAERDFVFSPDGRYVGYAALRENPDMPNPEIWWVVEPLF